MHQKNNLEKLQIESFLLIPLKNHRLKHESSQWGLQPPASVPQMARYRKINGPLKAMCYQMREKYQRH